MKRRPISFRNSRKNFVRHIIPRLRNFRSRSYRGGTRL